MTPCQLVIAISRQDESRHLIYLAPQQTYDVQRCLVRPMDVLDDKHRRFLAAQLSNERNRDLVGRSSAFNYLFQLAADCCGYAKQRTQRMRRKQRVAGTGYDPHVRLVSSEATKQHCLADSSLTSHKDKPSLGAGNDRAEMLSERREVFGSF